MTVYYVGRCARITDEVFESRWPIQRTFALRELRYPHTVRETAIRLAATSTHVRVCSEGSFALSVVVAVSGWPTSGIPAVSALGIVGAALTAVMVLVVRRLRRQPLEVRAIYRGELVCLHASTNRFVLGQVRRGLLRALEHLDETG
jgi:hypothetical protein